MQPDHVPGVHQLPAAGVRGVVTVQPFALIDDGAACGRSFCVGEPVILISREICPGDQLVHGLGDGIDPAEGSDGPFLCEGILLLRHGPADCVLFGSGYDRPLPDIVPVLIQAQHSGGADEVIVKYPVHVFRVAGAVRPVHQPVDVEGGLVAVGHPDPAGDHPGYGLILVIVDGTVQWDDHPEPGRPAAVLPGGIDHRSDLQIVDGLQDLVGQACRDRVHVEGDEVVAFDCFGESLAVNLSPDEAADVLQLVLVGFRHLHKFFVGFLRPVWLPEHLAELGPLDLPGLPVLRLP